MTDPEIRASVREALSSQRADWMDDQDFEEFVELLVKESCGGWDDFIKLIRIGEGNGYSPEFQLKVFSVAIKRA